MAKVRAKISFLEDLEDFRAQARLHLREIENLHVEEAEVKFGIHTVGELAILAITKVSGGLALKWKKTTLECQSNERP